MRADSLYSRQRFRCVTPEKTHFFTLPHRQPAHGHPHGVICAHCERDFGIADGPTAPPAYAQTIVEIGELLAKVGSGISLRRSSYEVRQAARRFTLGPFPGSSQTARQRRRYPSRENVMAARYLDAYGPAVVDKLLPTRWPRILVLDSKPLKIRPYGAVGWDGWDEMPSGGLLVAAGRDEDDGPSRAWRIGLAPDETEKSWLEFLDQLEGEPEWVVADRATAIWAAVTERFPRATLFSCAWHLGKNLTDAAYRDGLYFGGSPMVEAIEVAFRSREQWEALAELAEQQCAENVLVWMIENEALIHRQIKLREQFPGRARSNGAAENIVKLADARIGRRRRNFRNAGRLRTVLGLMTAEMRGEGDPLTYAQIVRDVLAGGTPSLNAGMDTGAIVDHSVETVGSLATMLLEAGEIRRRSQRSYGVEAKTRSVQRTADAYNAKRDALGMPLIDVHISAGGTASISVKGKMLSFFFEIAAEWDTEKNGRGPEGVRAGDSKSVHWRCAQGHEWVARTTDRVARLLRCRRCVTTRADETNSLVTLHPEILATWDFEGNRLDPHKIKATHRRRVSWLCRADLGHPAYRASIAKHLKDQGVCPLCRKIRPASSSGGSVIGNVGR